MSLVCTKPVRTDFCKGQGSESVEDFFQQIDDNLQQHDILHPSFLYTCLIKSDREQAGKNYFKILVIFIDLAKLCQYIFLFLESLGICCLNNVIFRKFFWGVGLGWQFPLFSAPRPVRPCILKFILSLR